MPQGSTNWHKHLIELLLNSYLSLFSVRPASWIRHKIAHRFCYVSLGLYLAQAYNQSSTQPLLGHLKCYASFWKYSWVDVIPIGKLLKQNLPNGVKNDVIREDPEESSNSQNP